MEARHAKPWACALCHLAPPDGVARSRKALQEGLRAEPFSSGRRWQGLRPLRAARERDCKGPGFVMRTIHINDTIDYHESCPYCRSGRAVPGV